MPNITPAELGRSSGERWYVFDRIGRKRELSFAACASASARCVQVGVLQDNVERRDSCSRVRVQSENSMLSCSSQVRHSVHCRSGARPRSMGCADLHTRLGQMVAFTMVESCMRLPNLLDEAPLTGDSNKSVEKSNFFTTLAA